MSTRTRFRVSLYNPLAQGLPNGNRPCSATYKGEASTMRRAYKRALASANPVFMAAGGDWQAVADNAFEAARAAIMRYPDAVGMAAYQDGGRTVQIEVLNNG